MYELRRNGETENYNVSEMRKIREIRRSITTRRLWRQARQSRWQSNQTQCHTRCATWRRGQACMNQFASTLYRQILMEKLLLPENREFSHGNVVKRCLRPPSEKTMKLIYKLSCKKRKVGTADVVAMETPSFCTQKTCHGQYL